MFRAPQRHGATQTHFPPRPRKSAWRCDITNVISPHGLPTHYKQSYRTIPPIIPLTSDTPRLHQHVSRSPVARRHSNAPRPRKSAWRCDITNGACHTVCPHTRSNHTTRNRQSSRSPATRRVYTSVFRAPQWHGATQTHFPPRPRKWHCDIADIIRHTVAHTLQAIISHDTANHPAHQRHAAFTPACFALPSGTATQTHFPPRPRKSAWRCDIRMAWHGTVNPLWTLKLHQQTDLESRLGCQTVLTLNSSTKPFWKSNGLGISKQNLGAKLFRH